MTRRPTKNFREEYAEALNTYLTAPRHGGITPAQIIALWKIRYEAATISHLKWGMPALAWSSQP